MDRREQIEELLEAVYCLRKTAQYCDTKYSQILEDAAGIADGFADDILEDLKAEEDEE